MSFVVGQVYRRNRRGLALSLIGRAKPVTIPATKPGILGIPDLYSFGGSVKTLASERAHGPPENDLLQRSHSMTAKSSRPRTQGEHTALLGVGEVAALLGCSTRHVRRLSDSSRMPPPLKLGSLVRWERSVLEEWIGEGCPRCAEGRGGWFGTN